MKQGKCLKKSTVHPTKADTVKLTKQEPDLSTKEMSNVIDSLNTHLDKSLTNYYKNSEENNLNSGNNNTIFEKNTKIVGQTEKMHLIGHEKRFVKMPLTGNEKTAILQNWQTFKKSYPIKEGQNTAIITGKASNLTVLDVDSKPDKGQFDETVRGSENMLLISGLKVVTLYVSPAFTKVIVIYMIIRNGAQFYQQ